MEREDYMKRIDSLAEKNKKLEAALTRHENVKAAIMAANEGLTLLIQCDRISITNAKGATIKANNTVLELLGYTQEETEKLDILMFTLTLKTAHFSLTN